MRRKVKPRNLKLRSRKEQKKECLSEAMKWRYVKGNRKSFDFEIEKQRKVKAKQRWMKTKRETSDLEIFLSL